MLSKKLMGTLKKQHYGVVGKHSVVHPCRWCKKSLVDEGDCYKQKFYGIKSHLCCQMSPTTNCQNKCLHCWRAIELSDSQAMDKKMVDEPKEIIKGCMEMQRKLLNGFKGNAKINMEKFKEAQEPMHFAISLTGEPTLYPKIGELIGELRKSGKTMFLVTNGLQPEVLKELGEAGNLPTQLYISLNCSNEKDYGKWHNSSVKNAWEKFNESLDVMKKLKGKTRRVVRMTLVKDLNMSDSQVEDYVKLIRKASPDFLEVKGFMSVGFARERLGYEMMPTHKEIKDYAKKIVKGLGDEYKVLDEHEFSRVVLVGRGEGGMRIKNGEV